MPDFGTCNREQKIPVTVEPMTENDNPAPIDGALTIEVLSGDGTFEQDPAMPNMFYAVSGAGVGVTVYRVSADANMSPGDDQVTEIQDTYELTVTDVMAARFGMRSGTPVPK